MKGISCSFGMIDRCMTYETENSDLVETFVKMGAIPLMKSVSSQGQVPFFEATNGIWGTSLNPWNTNRTCGTSSIGSIIANRFANFAIS